MSGHYRMHRRWMDHPALGREPFTKAQAWCWLIEKAAWKNRTQTIGKDFIPVRRGEYATSVRFLAERWQWTRMKAQRFLARLEKHGMIEKTGTASGTPYTVIRVCNYGKYQASNDEAGQQAGQWRDSTGTNQKKDKKGKERKKGADAHFANGKFHFQGRVIHLAEPDYERWRATYSSIIDFAAELQAADDYYATHPPKGGKWFHRVSRWLNKANREAKADEYSPII